MGTKSLEFKVRKLQANSTTEKDLAKKQPSRVYVNEEALLELTGSKDGGRAITIEKIDKNSSDDQPVRREATLWKSPERIDKASIQLYDAFRDVCGYQTGVQVKVTVQEGKLPEAEEVVLEQLPPEKAGKDAETAGPIDPSEIPGWEFFLSGRLSMIEHVHAGLTFKNLYARGPQRSFVVASVNGRPTGNARYLDGKTKVRIGAPSPAGQADGVRQGKLEVTGVRGLDTQIEKLNDLLSQFTDPWVFKGKPRYRGIVIHGGHGTGKSMLLNTIAATGWGTVYRIQPKDKLAEIQDMFQKARLEQPSIILIDQLERLIDKERNNRTSVIQALCEALDTLGADAQESGEIPKVAVIVTCLDYTTDVPEDLKDPGRLTGEIYLPLPDVDGRKEILASFNLRVASEEEDALLRSLSERTHAYNGKDLRRLVDEAEFIARTRINRTAKKTTTPPSTEDLVSLNDQPAAATEEVASLMNSLQLSDANANASTTTTLVADSITSPTEYFLPADYEEALRLVRPSAMHDVNLKPPPIHWSDIGGQASVKVSLRRAVRMSTEPVHVLSRFFARPPKGFLLYGPPGCSKTMAAQAMATESGLNFFAVKGAELLNMYVGESERAVRRLFQRAREVAPSMIFFDEIDSIAGQRSGFGHGGSSTSSGSGGSSSGLNVLTTLLNEMDGFEALTGVVVLAATNRPQALDPALLRPGRFDELIYVSPPDEEARAAIFGKEAEKRQMLIGEEEIERLATITDGFSGAEIKGICAVAGTRAYDRYLKLDSVEEDTPVGITIEDLEMAAKGMMRQITPEMIRGFEQWEKQFRRY
ncbi:P-loop containing nucleoside triphosphate hydrolase protein [Neurospora tetraspora]|uniref:P-loop containing nucleoside triphosphate hydrolase protein n=1 Tax=Neurospora tetraspora TaxID=94610 RepID=A0AAE0MNS0_9PEZI|nr:P-loop containing nucleoside triphosphate hydrolase protein [Neurospora tetraspora]